MSKLVVNRKFSSTKKKRRKTRPSPTYTLIHKHPPQIGLSSEHKGAFNEPSNNLISNARALAIRPLRISFQENEGVADNLQEIYVREPQNIK